MLQTENPFLSIQKRTITSFNTGPSGVKSSKIMSVFIGKKVLIRPQNQLARIAHQAAL